MEGISTDRLFYDQYSDLVDLFIDSVCSSSTRSELLSIMSKADRTLALDTATDRQDADLVNRISYKHEIKEGRTPLSYAVAKNLFQQVYNIIDLGANVNKAMLEEDDGINNQEDFFPKTALVIATLNPKRDGTEMVRILLSKGANPFELIEANVDEATLSRGMKYWIKKARRIGIPPRDELEHMAKLPPTDRIYELDYAVIGEEAAVSVIQESLAGRFGNPQGNTKPLVMLLLGPPGMLYKADLLSDVSNEADQCPLFC